MAKVSNLLLLSAAMLAIAAGLNTYSGYAPADPNSTRCFPALVDALVPALCLGGCVAVGGVGIAGYG